MLNLFDILCAEVRDTQEGPRAHILLFDPTGKERGTVKGIHTPRGKVDAKNTTVLTENVARTLAYVLRNVKDATTLAERIEVCITRKRALAADLAPALADTKATAPTIKVSPFRALAAAPAPPARKSKSTIISAVKVTPASTSRPTV